MSATARQRKGLAAEREVADIWKAHGLEVRNLEYAGDHLVIVPACQVAPMRGDTRIVQAVTLHSEVKRQERLKLPEWLRQAADEAPAGTIPVVSFRQNRGEWYACLRLEDLAELVSR